MVVVDTERGMSIMMAEQQLDGKQVKKWREEIWERNGY